MHVLVDVCVSTHSDALVKHISHRVCTMNLFINSLAVVAHSEMTGSLAARAASGCLSVFVSND